MQSAAVPCTSNSNGIKRTAANALLSDSSQTGSSNNSDINNRMNQSSDSPPPPEKRSFIVVESPLKLETIASAEDLDVKVLRIQNKNLSERLVQRQKLEAELKDKIEHLQNRKASDDSKLCIVDRYWTQLDEDLRYILERFDCNTSIDLVDADGSLASSSSSGSNKTNSGGNTINKENQSSNQSLRNFLAKLKEWDKVDLEENLKERVKFTTQTVSKLVSNYDRLVRKNEQYFKELAQSKNSESIEHSIKDLTQENHRLNELTLKLQQKLHTSGLEKRQLEDKISILEDEMTELRSKNDETEYELEKISDKAFKLDRQLAETLLKYQKLNNSTKTIINENNNNQPELNGHSSSTSTSSNNYLNKNLEKQVTQLEGMLEEQRELASSRLQELEKMNLDYQTSLKQIEKLKTDLKNIPESVIEQSNEYKYLQTKYSLIVNDNMKLRQAYDETKNLLEMSRLTFQRQLEQMESEELANQKKLGSEMMQMEEQLASVRKENELLRIEYEQNVAANEQTGPINKEMRSLITTLQANNKLLKSDNARTKKRLEEAQQEIERYKKQNSQLQSQLQHSLKKSTHSASSTEASTTTQKGSSSNDANNDADEKKDDDSNDSTSKKEENKVKNQDKHQQSPLKSSNDSSEATKSDRNRAKEAYEKDKNKKSSSSVIASPSSSSSTTHHVSSSTGNNAGDEHSNTPTSSNQLSSSTSSATPTHSNDINYKKIRQLEDQVRDLHKNLSNKKQEEAALLNDMEITGQAFEDMQEQNIRLMQQLREKDDANFKLISERIKLENVQKVLKEEKEMYYQQVAALQEQQEAQMSISKKVEEQLQLLVQNKAILEKEIVQLQQINESFRRQALENVQLIQDLKLNTQKYSVQLKEAQNHLAEKTEVIASQSYKNNRSQEEIKHLQLKLERQKRIENGASIDEVLKEENREYKEQLRCPSCKVKQKDAVLTKCFHVFCYDCLQKRYESRQRKCPKCNANFGANDFHKLYLS